MPPREEKQQNNGKIERQQLWELLEEFHECFFELNKDGEFVFVNKTMQETIGYNHKKLLGKKYIDFISDLYKNEVSKKIKDSIQITQNKNIIKCNFINDFLKNDGEYVLLEIDSISIFENNEFKSFRALAKDITDTKQNQIELLIKGSAMDKAVNGIIITTLDHIVFYANEEIYKMFEYDKKDEMVNLHAKKLWLKEEEYEKFTKKLKKEGEYKKTFIAKRKNNTEFHAQIYTSKIEDKFGKLLCYMKCINNINDEINAKNKIKEQKERLDSVLDSSDQGYWDYNIITNEIFYSPSWYKILGYNNKELPQEIETFYNLIHPEDLENTNNEIKKHINQETDSYNIELRMRCKDGQYKWILTKGKIVETKNNKPFRAVGTHTDITRRKKSEDEIKQKNKELEYFVHSASHDLQTPLVTIDGFSSIILEQTEHCSLNKQCKAYENINDSAQEIQQATRKLSNIIDTLLELSKIGQLHSSRKWVNISDIVKKVLELNEKIILENDAEIIIKNSLTTYVQEETFMSIIQNLITNSLQHAKTDKKLKIDLTFDKTKDNSLLIMVSDNGPGIPENMKEVIFEPFKRLTNKGNGLGLSIVKKGAELHDGTVCVENNPNGGTVFFVELKNCFKSDNDN